MYFTLLYTYGGGDVRAIANLVRLPSALLQSSYIIIIVLFLLLLQCIIYISISCPPLTNQQTNKNKINILI